MANSLSERLSVAPEHTWTLPRPLDADFRDSVNFGLSNDVVAVISALLTGLAMLLLTDVVFRVTVRSVGRTASTHAVFRQQLLSRAANPLSWTSFLSLSHRMHHTAATASPSHAPTRIPQWTRVAIAGAGVLLSAMHLALIFLATSADRAVEIDKKAVPTLALAARADRSIVRHNTRRCTLLHPLVSHAGLSARAALHVCHRMAPARIEPVRRGARARVAFALVGADPARLDFTVRTFRLAWVFAQSTVIVLPGGARYTARAAVTRADVVRVYTEAFRRRGYAMDVVTRNGNETSNDAVDASGERVAWSVEFDLRLNASDLDPRLLQGPPDEIVRGMFGQTYLSNAWNVYLAAVVRGQMDLRGRAHARAQGPDGGGAFLHETGAALVVQRRPRLGIRGSGVLCAALCAVWLVVACVLRLGGSVDHDAAWVLVVFGGEHGDFADGPKKTVYRAELVQAPAGCDF